MKERQVDREGAVVAHDQASEVPQPRVGAVDDPAPFVPPKCPAILRCRSNTISLLRADQFDSALAQTLLQRIAVVGFVGNHPYRLLPGVMAPPYPDRRERRFREPDFRRGCRVKVLSQGNAAAVDHHHPLRPLAPLGFSDSPAPFFAGAKLPSKNDSLHVNCWRSFNSLRNACQTFSQIPAPPNPATAASRSKDADIPPVSAAHRPRSAESRESLPAHGGSRSTGGPTTILARVRKQGQDILPLRFAQQRTQSGHRPSLGAAESAYLASEKIQLPSFQGPVLGYATASSYTPIDYSAPSPMRLCRLRHKDWR